MMSSAAPHSADQQGLEHRNDPQSVAPGDEPRSLWRRIPTADFVRIALVAVGAGAAGIAEITDLPQLAIAVFALAVFSIGCWPMLVEAWESVRERRMSMELSMLVAIVAAGAIGEWTTALVIAVFVLIAEVLEDLSMDRGRDALAQLMSFLPDTAEVRAPGAADATATEHRRLDQIVAGDVVVIRPGGKVPVDGIVQQGTSDVDESRITGESLPRSLQVDAQVFAGSINLTGALDVTVTGVGAESSYGRIIEAVREAQQSQAPVQRLADRLAAWLVYLSLAAAALTYLVTRDLQATISVVIVAGACGVAAGTPLAVLAAIARAARSGAFVKDGTHLERLSTIDTIVFDKTGTLTVGEPAIVALHPAPGVSEDDLLATAASVETRSEHPLAHAIVASAKSRQLGLFPVEQFASEPGRGVTGLLRGHRVSAGGAALQQQVTSTGKTREASAAGTAGTTDAPKATGATHTVSAADAAQYPASDAVKSAEAAGSTAVHVHVDERWIGTILLRDQPRASAARSVAALHDLGIRTIVLTGDSPDAARAIASEIGISEVHAGLLPEQKTQAIDQLRAGELARPDGAGRRSRRIAMVGDGVNDAPALARADVGIAMGSGTDIARESADVVLISSDLDDVVTLVRTARQTRRVIMVNFIGTIAVDAIGMALAGFGLLGPVAAALIHVGSESVFILNSARLVPGRQRTR